MSEIDLKEKMALQLASLEKLYKEISPLVDKTQDEEFEAKGWKDGFVQFIGLLEQMSFKAGYKKGVREGLEHNQKMLLAEIEAIKRLYAAQLNEIKPLEQRNDVHPDERKEAMQDRIQQEPSKSRKAKLQEKIKKDDHDGSSG